MRTTTLQITERISEEVCFSIANVLLRDDEGSGISAIACEALARRIVHASPPDRLHSLMSARFKHRQLDGDLSEMSSALEMAIDSHWCVPTSVSRQGH
jgi:hypothetical protein